MGKYSCTNCLKVFKQKSNYTAHINKKNPCINNIDKIRENIQTIINETIDIKLNIDNNISIGLKKKISINENIDGIIDEPFKQEKGLKRNTIDKYYTKPSVVKQCIELIKNYINI